MAQFKSSSLASATTAAPDRQVILSLPGAKVRGEWAVIRCPFHNDTNPSLSVKIKAPHVGAFKCFSCGEKGNYSKLADKLGIDTAAAAPTPDLYPGEYESLFAYTENQDTKDITSLTDLTDRAARNLGISGESGWRGFPVEFLRDTVHAKVADSRYLYFPVMVNGKEVGYIRAFVRKEAGRPSYLNKKGSWARDSGLFLFDQALALQDGDVDSKIIILVEGPRDAMRLLRAGLPAVAILGTNNWSEQKLRRILLAGVEDIILCMDGDEAGVRGAHTIAESCEGMVRLHDFALHEWEGEYDPCNMPKNLLRRLRAMYRSVAGR